MTRDELKENFLVAMDTLRVRKRRSALTVLGIVIGVTSVIAVAAIIQGLNRHVGERLQSLGGRVFFLTRMPFARPGRLPEHIRLRKHFRYEDAQYIQERCRSCEYVTAFGTRSIFLRVSGGSNEIRAGRELVKEPILRGADPEYSDAIPLFGVRDGRFISPYDLQHSRYVCVLGAAVAGSLFPNLDPVGREVILNGLRFEVIGVFEKDRGLFGLSGVDRFVIIPYSTFHKLYPESREHFIAVSVGDPLLLPRALDEVTQILRRLRRVPHHAENGLCDQHPGFPHRPVGGVDRVAGPADRRHQLHRPAGGRHRGDEHHADLGDRADPGNRYPQGSGCAAAGYPRPVSNRSHHSNQFRRRAGHSAGNHGELDGASAVSPAPHRGFPALGDAGVFDLRVGGPVFWLLPSQSRRQPRPDRVLAL